MVTRALAPGIAIGQVLVLDEPLSLWGGADPATGEIIEPSHPQYGEKVSGRVVVLPHGRGSSSSSSVIAEMLRKGLGPAAIVLREVDSILLVGVLVAAELYGTVCPVVVTDSEIDGGEWEVDGDRGALNPRFQISPQIADNG